MAKLYLRTLGYADKALPQAVLREKYYCSKIGKEPSGSKNRYGAIGGMIRDVTSGMIAWPRCRGLEGKIMAKI